MQPDHFHNDHYNLPISFWFKTCFLGTKNTSELNSVNHSKSLDSYIPAPNCLPKSLNILKGQYQEGKKSQGENTKAE